MKLRMCGKYAMYHKAILRLVCPSVFSYVALHFPKVLDTSWFFGRIETVSGRGVVTVWAATR